MADIEAIKSLLARYLHAHDGRDVQGVVDCWSDSAFQFDKYRGKEGIREFYSGVYASNTARRRHLLTNIFLKDETEVSATAIGAAVMFLIRGEELELHCTGVYHVDVVKDAEGWRMQRLVDHLDVPYRPGDAPQVIVRNAGDGQLAAG